MEEKISKYCFKCCTCGALFLGVILGFWYVASYSNSVVPSRTFQVSGEGNVLVVPDIVQLSFGVITEGGKGLADLQKENTEKVKHIVEFLKEQGVEEKDIQTQFYNISPRYQYFSCPPPEKKEEAIPCPPSEIVGYTINQNISVKIRDLNKIRDILEGIVKKGANTIFGLSFTVDDPTELQNKAREEAISKAKEKAKTIAKAGAFRLGKLISINEGVVLPPPIPLKGFAIAQYKELGEGAGIEPGSQEIKVNVTLTYEIK